MSRGSPKRSLADRRAERELFFWTIKQSLICVLLATGTAYLVIRMLKGDPLPLEPALRWLTTL